MTTTDTEVHTIPPEMDPETEHPFALAVRIGTRDLWIGNQWATESEYFDQMDLEVAHIIALNLRPGDATTDHQELRDGRINDPDAFATAVNIVREKYQAKGQILVSCAAGISRSATVAATVLSAEEKLPFEAAVTEIQKHRKRAEPHPKLQVNALYYLFHKTNRDDVKQQLQTQLDQVEVDSNDSEQIHAQFDT